MWREKLVFFFPGKVNVGTILTKVSFDGFKFADVSRHYVSVCKEAEFIRNPQVVL